jgi:hypothetical protein
MQQKQFFQHLSEKKCHYSGIPFSEIKVIHIKIREYTSSAEKAKSNTPTMALKLSGDESQDK